MIRDFGDTAADLFDDMTADDQAMVVAELGYFIAQVVHGIRKVVRPDGNHLQSEELPPVLPFQLVKLRGRDFLPIIREYRNQFRKSRNTLAIASVQEALLRVPGTRRAPFSIREITQCSCCRRFLECGNLVSRLLEG